MKSSKTFNNVSSKLLSQIPKLKPGETVVFQMINGVPNPEPDEKERSKDPILFPKVQLLTKMRLYDPHQVDSAGAEVGGFIDVGVVESWKGDDPIAFRCFVTGSNPNNPKAQMASRFQGKFELKGGNVKEEELYEIFWLSPQREGSPCADSSVEVIFKIVDVKADTKATITKVDRLKKAIDISGKLSQVEAAEIMSALNQPKYQDKEVLLAKIRDFAINNVDLFLKTYESKDTGDKAAIREAISSGLLSHDQTTGEVKIGDMILTNLKIKSGTDLVDVFVKWAETAENGKDVMANIKNQLKKEVATP